MEVDEVVKEGLLVRGDVGMLGLGNVGEVGILPDITNTGDGQA